MFPASFIRPTTFLLIAAILLVPHVHAKRDKIVVVTNNHTNYLSVRCFSFDNGFDVTHLQPWDQFKFRVKERVFYPSATMFNCSTNMGTFVAFRFNYQCNDDMYETCDWRFDEESAYRWDPKSQVWSQQDFQPNYESLDRGGVIQGYFAN